MSDVITYYLEMNRPEDLQQAKSAPDLSLVEIRDANYQLNKSLYQLVGQPWQWIDKLTLSDDQWRAYVENPQLRTWVAYYQGAVAGYFELLKTDDGHVEVAYFGLVPEMIGRGFGGYLLSEAVKRAWAIPGATRVWVHTCTLDHPAALQNYLSRGFKLYKQEQRPKGG